MVSLIWRIELLTYRNTQKEIEAANIDTAVIPLGSVEQHSSHLPIGTDAMFAEAFSEKLAERFDALLLPVLPISTCYEHKGKKGSVWMRPSTFYTMLQDIIGSLHSQGFKKVILILGHGGIFAAFPAVRELNATKNDLQVIIYAPDVDDDVKQIMDTKKNEVHAGESETSLMLYLFEELVNKEEMMKNDFVPDVPQNFLNYTPVHKLSPTGVWGEPSLATKEKGEKIFNMMLDKAEAYINNALKYAVKEEW